MNFCRKLDSIRPANLETKLTFSVQFSFSLSVVSNSLQPHWLQHTRLPCPSPTPGVYSNSCPLSWWGHPTISSSVISFSSRLQPFPASGSFQMNQFFTSGGQSTGFSFSISPSNEYSGLTSFRMDWLDLLAVQGTLESSPTPQLKSINTLVLSCLYSTTLTSIHDYWNILRNSKQKPITLLNTNAKTFNKTLTKINVIYKR